MSKYLNNEKQIRGQIEKVIYQNAENGYTVALLRREDQEKSIIIVGNMINIRVGEFVDINGEWGYSDKHKGSQFKVLSYTSTVPSSSVGIETYLASGFIVGIGPELAQRIVRKFGANTLDIMEHQVNRLLEVNGIGKKKLASIQESWEKQKKIRELVFFLQEHGITGNLAHKIHTTYGDRSIEVIKTNPYILVHDIHGVGFQTADKIADKLGFEKDSVFRAEAAVFHIMGRAANEGHNYLPIIELVNLANELINVDEALLYTGIENLETSSKIVVDSTFEKERVYLSSYYWYETESAKYIKALSNHEVTVMGKAIDFEKEFEFLEKHTHIQLADEQKEAIRLAFLEKVLVITGGPGVGKTTIINSIIHICQQHRLGEILLAAPTGKAAKRMTEVTGMESRTIHRLLEYDAVLKGFARTNHNPLSCDILIVDEASMIDIFLLYSIVRALPVGARFIMVGDINQLPSVGVGNVLKDIIKSGSAQVVRLNKIFRQAEESLIIVNSHRINHGENLKLSKNGDPSDFYYVERSDPNDIKQLVIDFVVNRIPNKFGYDPKKDIQVLAPMYKGDVGINALNAGLQQKLNPNKNGVVRGQVTFAIGDKVMQIVNNYDKEVFNGDIGVIDAIYHEAKELIVNFDGMRVDYSFNELDEIVLAYATSIHKSQGSEFPVVVIPLTSQHYMLLQRNLLYTGVTRGKKLVVLVGEKKALTMAIANDKTRNRYTSLTDWLTT
jgi:exodeoxyribonuclease V alpha subunit